MKNIFVYCPKSGDRVFVSNPGPLMRVIGWANGSRHLQGDLVHIHWFAASSGNYWRDSAKDLAKAILSCWQGVAWDDQGQINLAVPRYLAGWAAGLVQQAGAMQDKGFASSNVPLQLLLQGIGSFGQNGQIHWDVDFPMGVPDPPDFSDVPLPIWDGMAPSDVDGVPFYQWWSANHPVVIPSDSDADDVAVPS